MWLLAALAVAADCPTYQAEIAGQVAAGPLDEASGLVASGRRADRLWSHEDSGGGPRLVALGLDGSVQGEVRLKATAVDWEDIARHGTTLVVADIGDNAALRPHVSLWKVEEPETLPVSGELEATEVRFTYPEGPRDAEVLLVDPADGRLFVVSKGRESEHVIYEVPAEGGVAVRRGELPFDPAVPFRTAGDVAPDRSAVILRGYTYGWLFRIPSGATLPDALQQPPCPFPVAPEPQGESVAFGADGLVYTLSENGNQPLWRYRRAP